MLKNRKQFPIAALAVDPIGDPLADVYLFLLRKAAERKRELAANVPANVGAGRPQSEADPQANRAGAPS